MSEAAYGETLRNAYGMSHGDPDCPGCQLPMHETGGAVPVDDSGDIVQGEGSGGCVAVCTGCLDAYTLCGPDGLVIRASSLREGLDHGIRALTALASTRRALEVFDEG